ncbi:MAG: AAA family ATPase [Candidatus Acidiferrales bacterium]
MYKKYYGLTRSPFGVSPDPYFFYPTSQHKEALAVLHYGVLGQKGFVAVTGEVGTGKTLMVRCLLDALSRHRIAFAYVFNPRLSVTDFLSQVLVDLGLPSPPKNKGEMLAVLSSFLMARSRQGAITALVVDEAQLLSWELLEEIRLLTNLETSQHKLLQIVLVGQPELDRKLDSEELRQLKQRIGLRCHLQPLTLKELHGYMHRRLELAGANSHSAQIFREDAIDAIHQHSSGIPRLVNTLAENCLIFGYGKQANPITPEIVREVAAELRLSAGGPKPADSGDDAEERRKIRKALLRMLDELDGVSPKSITDHKFQAGVETT